MDNDVIFTSGMDNSDLKNDTSQAKKIVDDWVDDVKQRIESENIEIKTNIQGDSNSDFLKNFRDQIGDADSRVGRLADKWDKVYGRVSAVATRLAGVVAVAKVVTQITESWTRELTGYNAELKRSIELQNQLSERGERVRDQDIKAVQRAAGDDINAEIEALKKLEAQQRSALSAAKTRLKEAEEAQKALVANREDPNSDSVGAFFNNRSGIVGQFFDGKFNSQLKDEVEEAKRNLEEAEKAFKQFQGALEDAGEKKLDLDAEQVKKTAEAQRDLNKQLNQQLAIEKEKQLRAQGLQGQADQVRDQQSLERNRDRFAPLGKEEADRQARRIVAAEQETRAAERKKEADKEAAREREKAAQEEERFQKARERFEDRIADQKRRGRESEERFETRRIRLESRRQEDLRRRTGGVDASLEAVFSRIQQSTNKPAGQSEEAKHLQRLRELEEEAQRARVKQQATLDRIAAQKPERAQGLL